MISINDFGERLKIHYNDNDECAYINKNHHENFLEQFTDKAIVKYSDGGRYLMMECDSEETFNELLLMATKIPDEDYMYKFTLGETVIEKLPNDSIRNIELAKIMENGILTGRLFYYNQFDTGTEIEYEGKKIICGVHKCYEIKPITWIIDIKNRKIKSETVIGDPKNNGIITNLKQRPYNKNNDVDIVNTRFKIIDGKISKLILSNSAVSLNIPEGIKEVIIESKFDENIDSKKNLKRITLPSTLAIFSPCCCLLTTEVLELYDKIQIYCRINVTKELIIHYSSFDSLFVFLNSTLIGEHKYNCKILLYGKEKLTEEQALIIEKYLPNYIWCQETTKKKLEQTSKNGKLTKETSKNEEQPEKNELSIALATLYKVLTYYEFGEAETKKIKLEVEEYKQKLKELEDRFYEGEEDIESPEEIYNTFLNNININLANYEKDNEYHKIIDLINKCENAINGDNKDMNTELVNDLFQISNVLLPYLKDNYCKYYKQLMLDILSKEKNNISNYLNKRENTPNYTNEEEFIKYFWTIFYPILIEIHNALKDESTKRNLAKEIMDITRNNMSLTIKKARQILIKDNLEYLQELSNDLDKKIQESPFKEEYSENKNNILSYAKNIKEYYNNKHIREIILKSCSKLKKYIRRKPEEFEQIDRLINDIISSNNNNDDKTIRLYEEILNMQSKDLQEDVDKESEPESISFNEDNSETHKLINALYEIIRALQLLELEVDESIKRKQAFKRCRIID